MADRHAIVRTDNMSATTDGSLIISGRFYDAEGNKADIDNGNIVHIGDYDTNEREVRKVTVPSATSKIKNVGLVVTPELMYDESVRHGLEDYVNTAGSEITVMRFHENDIFSVTAEALDGTPAINKFVDIGTTTKLKVSGAESNATVGKIVDVETKGQDTYYAVQVTM